MGSIKKVSHLCLKVSDLEKAEEFYVGILGMTVVNRGLLKGQPLIVLGEGLGLTLADCQKNTNIVDHIGLRVDNIEKITELLNKAGIAIIDGPKQSPYGTSIYFKDPDGNTLECHDADRK